MDSVRATTTVNYLIKYLDENGFGNSRCARNQKTLPDTHRLQEARAVLDEVRADLLNRVYQRYNFSIGFVQGVLFSIGMMTLEELDALNRQDFFICKEHGGSENGCCENSLPPLNVRRVPDQPDPDVDRFGF